MDPKCNRIGGGGDTVFSGTILELLPAAANSGGRPGVVRVRSVYKGGNSIGFWVPKKLSQFGPDKAFESSAMHESE